MNRITKLWIAIWLVLAGASQAGATGIVCVNKAGVLHVRTVCAKKETPLNLGSGGHWSTTQNIAASGRAAGNARAATAVAANDLGSLCQNSTIPVAVETVVAQSTSTNTIDSNQWDVVVNGQLLFKNPNPVGTTIHVAAYVGTPTNCDSFDSCAPQMTKMANIFDGTILGGVELPIPFTLTQADMAANETAIEYVTVLVDDNTFPNGSDGLCISASGFSDEHDHVQ